MFVDGIDKTFNGITAGSADPTKVSIAVITQKAKEGGYIMDWSVADKNSDSYLNKEEFVPLYWYIG